MNRIPPGLLLLAVAIAVPWSGCQKTADTTEAPQAGAAAAPEEIVVTIAPVETRKIQRRASVVGTLAGFEEFTMTPKVEGRVEKIHFDVGGRVKPGTSMLELDAVDYKLAVEEAERGLETELAKLGVEKMPAEPFDIEQLPSVVRARLVKENAKRRADRQRNLFQTNAVSQEIYEQAMSDQEVAEASYKQARLDARTTWAAVRHRQAILDVANQKLQETTLRAPQFDPGPEFGSGEVNYVVSRRMVSVSEMVRAFPSTPVFELVIDDILKFKTAIPERYLPLVHLGQTVELRVEAWPGEVFPAKVSRIDPCINPENRTFLAEALVPNSQHRLKAGGFAKAEAVLEENAQALAVPLDAVVQFAGVTKVFRVVDKKVDEVVVRLGGRGKGWVEVIGDLKGTDSVVTSGQSKLSNGSPIRVRESPAPVAATAAK